MAVKIKRTVGGKIGHGSTPDILAVQKLLNRHAALVGYSKLEENGEADKKTIAAIKKFQQVGCPDIRADGRVEPGKQTLLTLNMSASDLKAWVRGIQSDDPGDMAQSIVLYVGKTPYEFTSQNQADKFAATIKRLKIDGKFHYFTPKEWKVFKAGMTKALNRTIVAGAKARAEMAYGLWQYFAKLNNDQYVVSWFVSLVGPDLPKFSIVLKASNAADRLESAVKSGNFDAIGNAIQAAEEPINNAYKVMWDYQKAVIGSAENLVIALKVTKTTSFLIVGAIATPLLVSSAGLAGAGALASGGTGLVSSSANELGKFVAGTSKGPADAIKNIALNTIVDASVGAVLKGSSGKKIFEGVGKKLAKKVGGKWIGKVGSKTAQKYFTAYLENSAETGVEEAIKEVGSVLKGTTKPEEFFGKVATAMAIGGFMKGFDKTVGAKFGKAIYGKISSKARKEIFGKLGDTESLKIINDIINGNTGNIASAGIEKALAAATGKESHTAIVDSAAKTITSGSDFSKFQKLLAARVAKRK